MYIDQVNHLRFEPVEMNHWHSICTARTNQKVIQETTYFPNLNDFKNKMEVYYYVWNKEYIDYTFFNAIDIEEDESCDSYWLCFDNLYSAMRFAIME